MDQHLEIIISKLKTRYKATCPLFPECKGIAPTEEAAVIKLSQSIAKVIKKMSEKNLQSLLLSNSYTEVILDSVKQPKTQKRIFRFDTKNSPNRTFSLKYKAPDISPDHIDENAPVEDIRSLLQKMDEILLAQGHSVQVVDGFTSLVDNAFPSDDGIAFGFPLSLN